VDTCRYFTYLLVHLFRGIQKKDIFSEDFRQSVKIFFETDPLHHSLESIVNMDYINKEEDEIYSTGYVIHSLEASLWSFYHSSTFQNAILKAVNLGNDADTIGAITGQIAGAYYGLDSIPKELIEGLTKRELIAFIVDELL